MPKKKKLKKRNKKLEIIGWSYARGHAIVLTDVEDPKGVCRDWRYEDDMLKSDDYLIERPCIKCNLKAESREHPDPCLGWLPNVKYACCGHGIKGEDYVLTDTDERLSLEEYCAKTGFKKPKELS